MIFMGSLHWFPCSIRWDLTTESESGSGPWPRRLRRSRDRTELNWTYTVEQIDPVPAHFTQNYWFLSLCHVADYRKVQTYSASKILDFSSPHHATVPLTRYLLSTEHKILCLTFVYVLLPNVHLCVDWFCVLGEFVVWWFVLRVNRKQTEVCFSPNVILCGWLGSKYQLTQWTWCHVDHYSESDWLLPLVWWLVLPFDIAQMCDILRTPSKNTPYW